MSKTYTIIFAAFEICSLSLFLELILKISLPKIGADFGAQIWHGLHIGADSYKS